MRTMSAVDAKNRFGRMQGAARQRLLDTIDQMHQEAAAKGLSEGKLDQLSQNDG